MGLKQELLAKKNQEYQQSLKDIPSHLHHADAAKVIAREWVKGGVGRSSREDTSPVILPIFTHLYLGPTDRFEVEVNLFMEEMEERLKLDFNDAVVDEGQVIFRYGPFKLIVFFHLHKHGRCQVITEAVEPVTIYNYKMQLVCD